MLQLILVVLDPLVGEDQQETGGHEAHQAADGVDAPKVEGEI